MAEAQGPFMRVRELDPADRESLLHLVRIALLGRDRHAIDSLTAMAIRETPGPDAGELRAVRAWALGDTVAQQSSLRELASKDGATLGVVAWRVGLYARDLDGAERILRLGISPSRPLSMQVDALAQLPQILWAEGRSREALQVARVWASAGGGATFEARLTRVSLLLAPPALASRASLDSAQAELDASLRAGLGRGTPADSVRAYEAVCLAGILAAERHDATAVAAMLEQLTDALRVRGAKSRARDCIPAIRGRVAFRAGDTASALRDLLAMRDDRVPDHALEVLDRGLIGEALLAMHRDREAEAWFATIAERGTDDLPSLAHAERRLGEIAERRRDSTAAVVHYARVLKMWAHADAPFKDQLAEARISWRR